MSKSQTDIRTLAQDLVNELEPASQNPTTTEEVYPIIDHVSGP